MDYRRAEKVKFEDDDYVYFVKAVPKINVKLSKKGTRRPAAKKPQRPVGQTARPVQPKRPQTAPVQMKKEQPGTESKPVEQQVKTERKITEQEK